MGAYVVASNVSKRFQLRRDRADSVGHLLLQMVPRRSRPKPEQFWALKDVSFQIAQGVSLGIIGNNGSGKSTMLKLLTHTMTPTSGNIAVNGRVSALIELGAGFHPDFTGRENIILNASILGIRRRDIEANIDRIIEFAEIRPFIDIPVKYYSSGMQGRLGFSVAVHVQPQILIVDEVLAVGDEAFQQKCMDRILEMKRGGTSIILVSHDLSSVERLMDEAIWIDHGVVRANGTPREVIHAYRKFLGAGSAASSDAPILSTASDSPVRVASVEASVSGKGGSIATPGDAMDIAVNIINETGHLVEGHLALSLRRPDGMKIAEISSIDDGLPQQFSPGVSTVLVSIRELILTNGRYEFDVVVADLTGRRICDAMAAGTFTVQGLHRASGLVVMPHEWRTTRGC